MGIVLDYAIGSLLSGAILTLFYFLLSSVLVAAYSIISKGSLSLLFKSSLQIQALEPPALRWAQDERHAVSLTSELRRLGH